MRKKKLVMLPLSLMLLSIFAGCSEENKNYKNGINHNESTVGYQLLVYSFNDSDGDGRGDIKGITQKLDYFTELGVNVLWLSPINKAGSYHGYDVQDYYEVNKKLGTKEDLKELIDEAHKRDIKILLDMVVNHTSNSHPWFLDACKNEDSKYRDFYTFKDPSVTYGKSNNSSAGWHSRSGKQYYSSFTASMPDLNLSSSAVKKEVKNIFKYWIDFGVDGFRLDAIKHFFDASEYASGTDVKKLTQNYFNDLEKSMNKINPNIFFVGEWLTESYTSYTISAPYIDSQFSFSTRKLLNDNISGSLSAAKVATKITTEINELTELNKEFVYTPIIGNHDHDRIASIGNFVNNPIKLSAISRVLLTLPGMPFIYSGDELAMEGCRYENDDIERRLPFLWGEGNEVNPDTYGRGKYQQSVMDNRTSLIDARKDPLSLFNTYKDVLNVRNNTEAYKGGKMYVIGNDDNLNIMAFLIKSKKQTILVAHCIRPRQGILELGDIELVENLYSSYELNSDGNDYKKDENGKYTYEKDDVYNCDGSTLTLQPFSTVIFEVK